MRPIESILFPVDFSERSAKSAAEVSAWANQFRARLVVLHVIDPADYFAEPDLHFDEVNQQLPVIEQRRIVDLDYFCNRYFSTPAIERLVVRGGKVEKIVTIAQKKNIDLLMLPRDHQLLTSRLFHDSLTARVLNDSPIPVWTTEYRDISLPIAVKEILCAIHVDNDITLDAANERLLNFSRVITATFSSALTCLCIDQSGQGLLSKSLQEPGGYNSISERWQRIREKMKDVAQFEIAVGDVATAIRRTAERISADLIILGRTRPGTVGLGVQVHILITNHVTHCPIISVL